MQWRTRRAKPVAPRRKATCAPRSTRSRVCGGIGRASLEKALASSGVAESPPSERASPLVLDEQGRVYLHRYFDYEQRLARRSCRPRAQAKRGFRRRERRPGHGRRRRASCASSGGCCRPTRSCASRSPRPQARRPPRPCPRRSGCARSRMCPRKCARCCRRPRRRSIACWATTPALASRTARRTRSRSTCSWSTKRRCLTWPLQRAARSGAAACAHRAARGQGPARGRRIRRRVRGAVCGSDAERGMSTRCRGDVRLGGLRASRRPHRCRLARCAMPRCG